MHEMVYIGFADTSSRDNPKPGCTIVRLQSRDTHGVHWLHKDVLLKQAAYPREITRDGIEKNDFSQGRRTLVVGGQDGFIALTCEVNDKYGIMLVAPDNQSRFLPLEEPPATWLWNIDFAHDTKTLVLSYANRLPLKVSPALPLTPPHDNSEHITRFVRWDTGQLVADTVTGWSAYAGAREAFLANVFQQPFTYDILTRRKVRNAHAEASLLRLLGERNSPRVKTGYRMHGRELPFILYGLEKLFALSGNLQFMFEMENREIGPPGGGGPRLDWSDDFVEDAVYASGRGILFSIIRGSHSPHSGFQFLNDRGDFRFLSTGPLRMGSGNGLKQHFPSYPPGIFEVTLASGRVHYTSPPGAAKGALAESALRSDVFDREIASNAVFLMKRGTAKGDGRP